MALMERPHRSAPPNMIRVPGGTFRVGSDKHYPEEAPLHRVTVSGFWIDRMPVTIKQFVRATSHKTFAEIPPDPKNYLDALPHMLYAGSLVFTPPRRPVDLKNFGEWWGCLKDANWRHRPEEQYQRTRQSSRYACRMLRCAGLREMDRQRAANRSRTGIRRHASD